MAGLNYSSIVVPTIRGKIKADYKKENNRLMTFKLELPANMVAEFMMDFDKNAVVTVNDEVVNLSFGNVRLNPGINNIEVRINSF